MKPIFDRYDYHDKALVKEYQERFGLMEYHIVYSFECAQKVSFAGKNVLEVGGSLPEDFVFQVLGAASWTAVESPEYNQSLADAGGITHKGTLLGNGCETATTGFGIPLQNRYSFFLDSIENIPESHRDTYDLVFSIAAFEHIQNIPAALDRIYDVLRPGGTFCTIFSPLWSSFTGHHLPSNMTDSSNVPIPEGLITPWGHLLMRPHELLDDLYGKVDRDTAAKIVYYVYQSPHINRLFTEDYLGFIAMSRFKITDVKAIYLIPVPSSTQERLMELYPGRKLFDNNGLYVVLEK